MAANNGEKSVGEQKKLAEVEFHYIKSNLYRVVHSDGAYGGITARGYLHVAFYNERRAIPKTISLIPDDKTAESKEEVTETIGGIVRELEVGVIMDEQSTAELIEWLTRKLNELRAFKQMISDQDGKADA